MAVLGITYCRAPETTANGDPRLILDPCPPEENIEDGLCGSLDVFENRETRTGRTIALRIVVLPALSGAAAPDPLFVLAGGPGQAATELADVLRSPLRGVNRDRDIVLVDQRGTGGSNPLTCDLEDGEDDEGALMLDPMADSLLLAETLEDLRECAASLDADPRLYTTPIAMDDLDDVRDALGYDTINLWGGSYGTRAGLVYIRRHPDRVRTAVLDGLAPAAIRLPVHMGRDGHRALQLTLEDCALREACRRAFPTLEADLEDLLARLERGPVEAVIEHPRTGKPLEITVTRTSLASLIRSTLYSPDLVSLLPLAIHEAARGDYQTLTTLGMGLANGSASMNTGMFLSVVCSEDVPLVSEEDRMAAGEDPFLGTRILDAFTRMCGAWPRGDLPPGYTDPIVSDTPILLLSGFLDPVTPPAWGETVLESLSNALHVTVPGTGHNTLGAGCVPDLIEQFVESAGFEGLDTSCVDSVRRPDFFDTRVGPGTGLAS